MEERQERRCVRGVTTPGRGTLALLLGVTFLLLAFSVMFIYVKMHEVTSSGGRFQAVPFYVSALKLFICGLIMLLLSKCKLDGQLTALRFAGAIFAVSLCLCVISIVMTFWLAETHDSMTYCIYNPEKRTCACRADIPRPGRKANGWTLYETVTGCRSLDVLFRLMIISMIVYATAAFCCALGLLFVYSLVVQRQNRHQQNQDDGTGMDCPIRNGQLPPSYEVSQRYCSVNNQQTVREESIFAPNVHCPPPPYTSSSSALSITSSCAVSSNPLSTDKPDSVT